MPVDKSERTTITREDLTRAVHQQIGLSRNESARLVETFIGSLYEELVANGQVKLSSFGTFDVRERAPRTGRNPKTGEEAPVPRRRIVVFRPSDGLKRKVDAGCRAIHKKEA